MDFSDNFWENRQHEQEMAWNNDFDEYEDEEEGIALPVNPPVDNYAAMLLGCSQFQFQELSLEEAMEHTTVRVD